jgi:hypothetical protein
MVVNGEDAATPGNGAVGDRVLFRIMSISVGGRISLFKLLMSSIIGEK